MIASHFFFHFFVSETQFDRCLDQLFGIVLSPEDDAKLMEKYGSPDPKRRGMVSYRKFCEVIGAGTMIIYFLIFFGTLVMYVLVNYPNPMNLLGKELKID